MKIYALTALLSISLIGSLYAGEAAQATPEIKAAETKAPEQAVAATPQAKEKKPEAKELEPYKPPMKVSISPAIPMGGVKVMTQAQYENNKKDLETVTNAINEFQSRTGQSNGGDVAQENLLKERQAYLSFTVKSYECYHSNDAADSATEEKE